MGIAATASGNDVETARSFGAFAAASLLSAAVDQGCFNLFYWAMGALRLGAALFVSIAAARVISILFNYFVNRNIVFRRKSPRLRGERHSSFVKYAPLAGSILLLSYLLTRLAREAWPGVSVWRLKLTIDLALFLISFSVQKTLVFRSKRVK